MVLEIGVCILIYTIKRLFFIECELHPLFWLTFIYSWSFFCTFNFILIPFNFYLIEWHFLRKKKQLTICSIFWIDGTKHLWNVCLWLFYKKKFHFFKIYTVRQGHVSSKESNNSQTVNLFICLSHNKFTMR